MQVETPGNGECTVPSEMCFGKGPGSKRRQKTAELVDYGVWDFLTSYARMPEKEKTG